MQWKVRSRRQLYGSEWVNLELADVELPNGNGSLITCFGCPASPWWRPSSTVLGFSCSGDTGSSPIGGAGSFQPVGWMTARIPRPRHIEKLWKRPAGGRVL